MDDKTYYENVARIEQEYEKGDINCSSIHPLLDDFMNNEVSDPQLSMVVGTDRLMQQIAICFTRDVKELIERRMEVDNLNDEFIIGLFCNVLAAYRHIRKLLPQDVDLTPLGMDDMHSILSADGSRFLTHDEIIQKVRNGEKLVQYIPEDVRRRREREDEVEVTVFEVKDPEDLLKFLNKTLKAKARGSSRKGNVH